MVAESVDHIHSAISTSGYLRVADIKAGNEIRIAHTVENCKKLLTLRAGGRAGAIVLKMPAPHIFAGDLHANVLCKFKHP